MKKCILAVNPGSTSTKAALYEDGVRTRVVEIAFAPDDPARAARVMDQLALRMEALRQALGPVGELAAVAGRGGFLAPVPGGVYRVNERMLNDLARARFGEHASNLGAFMAGEFAREHKCPAFVVDPVATDELMDAARLTGLPEIPRRSIFHALGSRAAAREAARQLGLIYERSRFIVAYLGGGISIGAHRLGRVVDMTNALDGEGPFSPERSGALPLLPVLELLEKGVVTPAALRAVITSRAGLMAHLGTSDLREVEARMAQGDEKARKVFDALTYAIAKGIGGMAPALEGRVDGVILAGGMARSEGLTRAIGRMVEYLGPVIVVAGLQELEALVRGVELALAGEVEVKEYASL